MDILHPELHLRDYKNNKIMTSKYTPLTFLPKNLYEQFSKMANVYFLVIAFMQTLRPISISGGNPVMLMPLSFVIVVSMVKDIFEDWKRHKSDHSENFKATLVYDRQRRAFVERHWQDLHVGDVVRVQCDQFFPADIAMVQSSEAKGVCYIETKNLDGETNLKHKNAEKFINHKMHEGREEMETILHGELLCEEANDQIYKFEGTINHAAYKKRLVLNSENLLLRGSSLRNTDWVIGFVVYAGHQTKIMMNSSSARFKKSKLDRQTNSQIIQVFFVQCMLCLIGAIFGTVYQLRLRDFSYLGLRWVDPTTGEGSWWDSSWILMIIKQTGTWILIFTYANNLYHKSL